MSQDVHGGALSTPQNNFQQFFPSFFLGKKSVPRKTFVAPGNKNWIARRPWRRFKRKWNAKTMEKKKLIVRRIRRRRRRRRR
jgi:hypothetical protein